MRCQLFVLFVVSLLPLGATETLLTVTPQTLGPWALQGMDKQAMAQEKTLILPAGAQLSRNFPSCGVILHLISHPVFFETSADWPILGVGPAALVLMGKAGQGRLVLVIDEAHAEVLPWTIPLNGKDEVNELFVAFDPISGAVLIKFKEQIQTFLAAPRATPVEVWLSAGAKAAWPQDLMEVHLLGDANETGAGALQAAQDKSSQDSKPIDRLKAALEQILEPEAGTSGSATKGTALAAASTEPVSTLEVYTSPAVRRAKVVEIVRATVASKQGK